MTAVVNIRYILVKMSVGWEVKWCPESGIKKTFALKGFRIRVGSRGPPGKLQNFQTDH